MEKNIKIRTGEAELDFKATFGHIDVKVAYAFIPKPTDQNKYRKYYESYKIKVYASFDVDGDLSALKEGGVYMDNNQFKWEYVGNGEFVSLKDIVMRFSTDIEFMFPYVE